MYASNVENVEKRFLGKVIHCISGKKTYFKIHARWVLSTVQPASSVALVEVTRFAVRLISINFHGTQSCTAEFSLIQ